MAAPRKYPDELRERATRLAVEARKDPAGRGRRDQAHRRPARRAPRGPAAAGSSGPRPTTAPRPGTTSADAARIAELEREVKELRRANAILKSAAAFFAAELDRPLR